MNKCPNCNSTNIKKINGEFICLDCNEHFDYNSFNELNLLNKKITLNLCKTLDDNWGTLRKKLEESQLKIDDYENEIDELNKKIVSIQSLYDDKTTIDEQSVEKIMKLIPSLKYILGNKSCYSTEEINDALQNYVIAQVNKINDILINNSRIDSKASDDYINKITKSYNVLDLINNIKTDDIDNFTAPAAVIRKSVEKFIKTRTNIKYDPRFVYMRKSKIIKIYDEIKNTSLFKKYFYDISSTLYDAGILPNVKNYNLNKPKYFDNEEYYSIKLFLRFYNTNLFKTETDMEHAINYWETCNLFIHSGAIENACERKLIQLHLDDWKNQTLNDKKKMFDEIYWFFKNHGVRIIGD